MTANRSSVLLPVFNHAQFVAEAIESVLEQTHSELELLILDDGSSDGSWDVISRYRDPRIQAWRNQDNQGAHRTLNTLSSRARGDWIAVLNSDDQFHPDRLQTCIEHLRESDADLVGTDITLIGQDGSSIADHWWLNTFQQLKDCRLHSEDWVEALLEGNVFMTSSNFVFSRSLLRSVQTFRDFRYVLDYDFLFRALLAGKRLGWIDAPLLSYRLHEQNTISGNPMRANLECAAMLRELAPRLIGGTDSSRARKLDRLASQWQRIERYLGEIAAGERHAALVAKENELMPLIRDRDIWIAERDRLIAERDRWIRDRDQWILDRDRWIRERDAIIFDRDRSIEDRDRWVQERDGIIHERDLLIDSLHDQVHGARVEGAALRGELAMLRNSLSFRLGRAITAPVRWLLERLPHRQRAERSLARVGSFGALRSFLAPRLGSIRCVSFDVFDTLLARCVEPPDDPVRRVASLLAEQIDGMTAETALARRRIVENRLRQESLDSGFDHECHYDPLVEAWIRELVGRPDPDLIEFVQRTEQELEELALTAKPGALETLQWLRSSGVRVIAVSDMYLSHDHLVTLLASRGLGCHVDQVYVSSEFGLGKYSGRLHRKVLETEGLHASEVVHVGDNLISDMNVPMRLDMTGVFLDERGERRRRRRQMLAYEMAGRGGIWPGRRLCEVIDFRMAQCDAYQEGSEDFYFRYGARILGPAFSTFLLGLAEQIQATRPDRIYFLARDGFLFQRMYERWRELEPVRTRTWPEPTYLYTSRRVVATASVADGLTHEQATLAFHNPKQQGLLSLFKTFGLPTEAFAEAAARHGFRDIAERLDDWNDPRLVSFLADDEVQSSIRAHGHAARRMLRDYFAEHGFFATPRVALVDVGWNGTIQKFLAESFSLEPGYPEVHGWYFAFSGALHGDFGAGERVKGIMLDQRRNDPYEQAIREFEELFEQGARAPEATTLGYAMGTAGVIPVLKDDSAPDRMHEIACNALIERFQQGVLTHLEHFHAAWRLTGYSFAQIKPYAMALIERAVSHPTPEEVSMISQLAHTEDFGHDALLDLGPGTIRKRDLLRPLRLADRLRLLAWPHGAIAHQKVPLATLLFRTLQFATIGKDRQS